MPAKVFSAATIGVGALPIEIEVDVSSGLHAFHIVGLGDKAIEESKERVSSALKNMGAQAPFRYNRRITVNLAPADFKKEGAGYDLAIAVGFLLASGQLFPIETEKKLFLGELALEGKVRRVSGVLPILEMAKACGFEEVYLPEENVAEAAFLSGIKIIPARHLTDVVLHLEGKKLLEAIEPQELSSFLEAPSPSTLDMADIAGQEQAKRALEIAAAGGHNILFEGPPGTGKTLLARTLPTILPRLALEEALEVTKIYSVAGLLHAGEPLIVIRPFRAPHHTASAIAVIGGGQNPKPGEVSLAHRGVLFLDEFPEFPRHVIENLRQPLEDGFVTISRAKGSVVFPSQFMLVAAMNPCPCGWYGDPRHECTCNLSSILKYRQKLSGPLLDRIDLTVAVPRISYEELQKGIGQESSSTIQARVARAREIQKGRFSRLNEDRPRKIFANAEIGPKEIREFCALDAPLHQLLRHGEAHYGLSPRGIHRVLKTSRTIADLAGEEKIKEAHLAEALQYRELNLSRL